MSAGSFSETAAGNQAHLPSLARKISNAMLIYLSIYSFIHFFIIYLTLIIYLRHDNNPLFTSDLV